jgi:hypothetical protein
MAQPMLPGLCGRRVLAIEKFPERVCETVAVAFCNGTGAAWSSVAESRVEIPVRRRRDGIGLAA